MTADDLARLAEKYATLGELRRARDRGDAAPPRATFRALSQQFPGCLRELDTLPIATIDARRDALARAANGGAIEPWMEWVSGYHAAVRDALAEKKQNDGAPRGAPRTPVNDVVFADLARVHGVSAGEIAAAIFPRRRSG